MNNAIFLLACLAEGGTGKRLLLNLSVYTMSKIALSKSVKKFVNSVSSYIVKLSKIASA